MCGVCVTEKNYFCTTLHKIERNMTMTRNDLVNGLSFKKPAKASCEPAAYSVDNKIHEHSE